jgi:hypothetical protein
MAYDVHLKDEILRITFSGTLTSDDLLELAETMLHIEGGTPLIPPRLTNRNAVAALDIRFPDVHGLALRRRKQQLPNRFKSAIVATDWFITDSPGCSRHSTTTRKSPSRYFPTRTARWNGSQRYKVEQKDGPDILTTMSQRAQQEVEKEWQRKAQK